jgi:excinuclease UvrABC ATPase subunit
VSCHGHQIHTIILSFRVLVNFIKYRQKSLYKDLTDKQKNIILNGSEERLSLSTPQMQKPWNAKYPGIIPYLNRVYHDPDTSEALHEKIDPFVVSSTCSTCQGYRVGEAARNSFI